MCWVSQLPNWKRRQITHKFALAIVNKTPWTVEQTITGLGKYNNNESCMLTE
jgi:hypothetical protein